MRNWLIIWAWTVGEAIQGYTYHRHLTTDPTCKHYRAPKPGSLLDRWSRGLACNPCMVSAAFGDAECRPFSVDMKPFTVVDMTVPLPAEPRSDAYARWFPGYLPEETDPAESPVQESTEGNGQ